MSRLFPYICQRLGVSLDTAIGAVFAFIALVIFLCLEWVILGFVE